MVCLKALGLIIITAIAMASAFSRPAHAAGIVLVNPPITGQQPTIGSTFSVQIKVANIDPFNAWDIQVVTDPAVINATSLSIFGNVLEANYSATVHELANCVNGGGIGCQLSDGQGIVHSAALVFGPSPQQGPSSGLLFTITYKVVSTGSFSPLELLNYLIASNGAPVSVASQDGAYGTVPPQNFALTSSMSSITLIQGSNTNVTLTVSSVGGFSGVVALDNTSSVRGLSIYLNATNISLSQGRRAIVAMRVAAHNTTSATGYTLRVTGRSGFLFHSATVSVTVTPPADFILDVSPSVLKIHASGSGSSIITASTRSGFSGSIRLKMDRPPIPGLLATLGSTNLTISQGVPATTVFSVRTPPSDLPFVYLINITAISQSSVHSPFTISVKSPSPDFGFQISGSGFSVQAGQSRTFTLNATSVDYFKGQLFLLATSLSGVAETFTRPAIALDFGNSSTSMMTIATDVNSAPGSHAVNVTALGTTFLGASVTHVITMVVTVIQPLAVKTILGVQPVAYFGILGVLWLALVGIAVREVRKPKPKRFLS
ncbi:MAG TPA: hypothetical protein VGS11_09335 [Candidatus Bathyarchaeia archaeon]|nr:hypothetical protein [Candidatus Bathyarchaeia archaeon]